MFFHESVKIILMEYGERSRKHRLLIGMLNHELNQRIINRKEKKGDYDLLNYLVKKMNRIEQNNPKASKDFLDGIDIVKKNR